MNAEDFPFLSFIAPLTFVFGAIYLFGPVLTLSGSWPRMLVFGIVWLVIVRYLDWRLFTTVMPADGEWYEVGWVWFCFAVEILALFDALILYLAFLRTSDRQRRSLTSTRRDCGHLSHEQLPSVDIYIPTYNESLEVSRKDDHWRALPRLSEFQSMGARRRTGLRPWVRRFAKPGRGLLTRPDNAHAKQAISITLDQDERRFRSNF